MAMEEVLGRSGVAEALEAANLTSRAGQYPPNNQERQFDFFEVSGVQAALERLYGKRTGLGLALKSGRACFRYGLLEFGRDIGAGSPAFRLMPLQAKISKGIEKLAGLINLSSDQQVSLSGDEKYLYWTEERCPICWSRKADGPICHLTVGMLEELLSWISGGRRYWVEEIHCTAQGDPACVMRINKQPYE